MPAFIGGPAVSSQLAGQWYNNTVHLVDLHATVIDLAGGVAAQPSGVAPVDGVSLVGVLNGSIKLSEPVRTELWIADDVLRQDQWKLISGAGVGRESCMLGIGGRPVAAANDPNNLTTTCGTLSCHDKQLSPIDAEICYGCKCVSYNLTDPSCRPCLYDVVSDPGEFTNLASQNPERVAAMFARVLELQKSTVTPNYPPSDATAACAAMVAAGGFYVPWAKPPPPPSVLTPQDVAGNYTMDGTFRIELAVGPQDPSSGNFSVSFPGCPSCCWTDAAGTGTVFPTGGGALTVEAQGAKCDSPRMCSGTLAGGGAGDPVQIQWDCTCHDPPTSCGAMGESAWVKQA